MLRFTPSLNESLSVENLRIALLNYIYSKQLKEELIIRLDDVEKKQNIEGKEKEVLETLALFGIEHSRVVAGSENIKYHTGMAMKLLLDKKAFNCFCSNEALELDKQKAKEEGKPYSYSGFCETISDETKFQCNAPFVVRLKKPDHDIRFNNLFQGELQFSPDQVDSVVILNHDKTPTSNFACAVDDMLYDISTIIRKQKHLNDTPKQIYIREALGYEKEIQYIHLAPILNSQDKELTKSDTFYCVQALIDEGYLPIAIVNYLISLGYDHPKEIFTIEEAIEWFDIQKLSSNSVTFVIERLNFYNCEHMKMLEDMRFSKIIGFADEDLGKLAKLYIEECNTINEIKEKIQAIFSEKTTLDGYEKEFELLKGCLQKAPFIGEFDKLQTYITDKTRLKEDTLFVPLSFALTGTTNETKLKQIYPLIKNYLGEII